MPRSSAASLGFSRRSPEGDGWLHEIKFDGYRTELVIEDGEVRAYTCNGHDWSDR